MPNDEGRTWAQVGQAVTHRREERRLTQRALADTARLTLEVVQELESGQKESYRETTLTAIAKALGWPGDAVQRLLAGEEATVLGEAGPEAVGASEPAVSESPDARTTELIEATAALRVSVEVMQRMLSRAVKAIEADNMQLARSYLDEVRDAAREIEQAATTVRDEDPDAGVAVDQVLSDLADTLTEISGGLRGTRTDEGDEAPTRPTSSE